MLLVRRNTGRSIRRVAELLDEKLFKQPPPKEDCLICMIPLPTFHSGSKYYECCGKIICSGCIHAVENTRNTKVPLCPFCRTPKAKDEDFVKQLKNRVDANDPKAIYNLGCLYQQGSRGYPQDYSKAIKYWQEAGKAGVGDSEAYYNVGNAYMNGDGVQRDMKKAIHY